MRRRLNYHYLAADGQINPLGQIDKQGRSEQPSASQFQPRGGLQSELIRVRGDCIVQSVYIITIGSSSSKCYQDFHLDGNCYMPSYTRNDVLRGLTGGRLLNDSLDRSTKPSSTSIALHGQGARFIINLNTAQRAYEYVSLASRYLPQLAVRRQKQLARTFIASFGHPCYHSIYPGWVQVESAATDRWPNLTFRCWQY